MDDFRYQNGQLYCEQVDLNELATRVGTAAYVYSRHTFEEHYDRLVAAFGDLKPLICYSIKCCGNINICRLLANRGAGMDVVSGGELYRAQQAGADMKKIVYAGAGKTDAEIRQALEAGIGYFNIESEAEFENIAAIAAHKGKTAKAALRVNPDVADEKTHEKTTTGKKETKFGVDIERARRFFVKYGGDEHLKLCAIHLHIGSPIYSAAPYVRAINKTLDLIDDLHNEGFSVTTIDIGGGFAADYETGASPDWTEYADKIVPLLRPFVATGGKVILEPGRTIAANAGVLLSRVQYVKMGGSKKFVIVDTGMHHLLRPTLYDAFHFVWPTKVVSMHEPVARLAEMDMPGLEVCDIVGPICETGDFIAKDRAIPPVTRGDLLCTFSAGAYGMTMANQYNAQPRPVEVLVEGDKATIIRQRETYEDIVGSENDVTPV